VSVACRDLLLANSRVTMVGVSANPARPSYRVAVHMIAYGYDVVVVNPTVSGVLGRPAYPSLEAVDGPLGIVDVFRRAEEIPNVARQAVALGAAAVWAQLGLRSGEARAVCEAAGVPYVEDRCIKMEHCRWFGGLNWFGLNTGVVSSRREQAWRAR